MRKEGNGGGGGRGEERRTGLDGERWNDAGGGDYKYLYRTHQQLNGADARSLAIK